MYLSHELIFSILAFLIVLWSSIVYWIGIFRGTIIPHPFTYCIWVIVLSISATELIREDEWKGALAIMLLTLSSLLALLWGLGHWKKLQINWIDYCFLMTGIVLIIFWQWEPHYQYVLMVMIVIDATAYASSFKKAWIQPFTEQSLPYFISVGNNVCTIFAISVWNFENLGMWIWTALINFIFACFILERQYSLKQEG